MKNFLSTYICLTLVTIRNFFDETNEKVIGKMKDVSEGKVTGEFIGLESKMYSIKNIDGKETNTG